MTGDQRVRHCSQCDRNVYNLSELTCDEAVALIGNSGERICGRLLRRDDGTVVTKECPTTGKANRIQRRIQFSIGSLFFLMTFAAGICAAIPVVGPKIADVLQTWLAPPAPKPSPGYLIEEGGMIMGDWEILPEETSDSSSLQDSQ